MTTAVRLASLDDLLETLASGSSLDDGEPVDLLRHSLQCAALLAAARPSDVALQVAGLVHDVGSILEPDAPATHAATGAAAVTGMLGPRVARLVARHADAKRYLVATDPGYGAALSGRSAETLAAQGGPMGRAELRRWQGLPDLADLVTLRRADDAAKDPDGTVPGLEAWTGALREVGDLGPH